VTAAVARHRTALSRTDLSRPVALALKDGLLEGASVFDFGCGVGDDLRRLTQLGVPCSGWDPVHRPRAEQQPADVVNLGYVVNVIEDLAERVTTLRRAWELAQKVLIVSGRLIWDAKDLRARPMGDGVLTQAGTFQKFYTQEELRAWIEQVLDTQPIAAAPGVFYIFRDLAAAQTYLAQRVSSRASLTQPWVSDALFERHQELLQPLVAFLCERARLPRAGELPEATAIRAEVGSLARAFALIVHKTGPERWEELREGHRLDLIVYIALSRFDRRPRFSELSETLQHDVREFLGNYRDACVKADQLLFAAGNPDALEVSVHASLVGKLSPTSLYVHRDAIGSLPALLRVYEGCARALAGEVEGTTLIKLSREHPQVSYLAYPDFDRDPHPTLTASVVVNLRRLSIDLRDYSASPNPPILHRKEEFLAATDPRRIRYQKLTAAEMRAGLYEQPSQIGTRDGWRQTLADHSVQLRGHQLIKAPHRSPSATGHSSV
jgi:DNA phosphorothioation-associated putative methyltransferase